MGLSRNKVAVPEGAAGTSPFWSGRGSPVQDSFSTSIDTVDSRLHYNGKAGTSLPYYFVLYLSFIYTGCKVEHGRPKRQTSPMLKHKL